MARTRDADLPARRMSPRASVVWALIPLFTLGLGTMFVLAWAAHRLRSRALGVAAVVALIMTVIALPLSGSPEDSAGAAASVVLIILLIGGGLTATFLIRRRLIEPGYRSRVKAGRHPAIDAALERRQRRAEARLIADRDPALARELRIGRPDLPRQYDDGGLVDVNHAPVAVLATLPGFTQELAERVARTRDERHGFAFVQELEVYADLPIGLVDELAERLVLLRLRTASGIPLRVALSSTRRGRGRTTTAQAARNARTIVA